MWVKLWEFCPEKGTAKVWPSGGCRSLRNHTGVKPGRIGKKTHSKMIFFQDLSSAGLSVVKRGGNLKERQEIKEEGEAGRAKWS